jgi:hypothetical protein
MPSSPEQHLRFLYFPPQFSATPLLVLDLLAFAPCLPLFGEQQGDLETDRPDEISNQSPVGSEEK